MDPAQPPAPTTTTSIPSELPRKRPKRQPRNDDPKGNDETILIIDDSDSDDNEEQSCTDTNTTATTAMSSVTTLRSLFRVSTLNVSLLQPSSEIVRGAWTAQQSRDAIASLARDSDVLCVQEWPASMDLLPASEWLQGDLVKSHCGNCSVMLRKSVFKEMSQLPLPSSIPASAVLATLHSDMVVAIASVHSTPFGGEDNAASRQHILEAVHASMVKTFGFPAIIAGDFNMRQSEDSSALKLGLRDAFVEAGQPKDKKFTWNSHTNRYHREARKYTARYDRIYFQGSANVELAAREGEFNLFAHEPLRTSADDRSSEHFHLSDHFGLTQQFQIECTVDHKDSDYSPKIEKAQPAASVTQTEHLSHVRANPNCTREVDSEYLHRSASNNAARSVAQSSSL